MDKMQLPECSSCTEALQKLNVAVAKALPEVDIFWSSSAPVIDKPVFDRFLQIMFAALCTNLPQGRNSGIILYDNIFYSIHIL